METAVENLADRARVSGAAPELDKEIQDYYKLLEEYLNFRIARTPESSFRARARPLWEQSQGLP